MDFKCSVEVWNGFTDRIKAEEGIDLTETYRKIPEYRKEALIFAAKHGCCDNVLYSVIQHDSILDVVTTVSLFRNTVVTKEDIDMLLRQFPDAEFGIIYAKDHRYVCERTLAEEKSKRIVPLTLKEANAFVKANHRHHDNTAGCKFALGLVKTVHGEEKLIGCAIAGRPVSRVLDNGKTLEINRLCTIETGNCCSMLYGACCRVAQAMGYKKVITYILESESGNSLKASNFIMEAECCGAPNWTGSRKRTNNNPNEMKQRWSRILTHDGKTMERT